MNYQYSSDPVRKMPASDIAEQSLLGSVMIDPESFNMITELVGENDFYYENHAHIFAAMRELFLESRDIDIVTLIDMLVRKGVFDKSGGEDYIRLIAQTVPNALNIRDYARIVRDKSTLRQLITACGEISENAFSEGEDVVNIIDDAQNKIYSIAQGRDTKSFIHIREAVSGLYEHLQLLEADAASMRGTMTGFDGLDSVLAGMGKGDLVLVGARPGMGKTSFALNIATNVAKSTKKTVCIFSLEMSAEQLASRMLSSEALVDSHALRTGELRRHWNNIAAAASRLAACDILIDDTSNITITAMKSKLRRVDNLGMIIIDYLQLMQSDRRIDNRVQEVGDISRNLKIMAKELGVPLICCAQLSRGPESRTTKRPMLSDLRDSGAIEQDADVVVFLYREDYYANDKKLEEEQINVAEVIIAKNRHGSTGTVKMAWVPEFTLFRTIDEKHDKEN